jgi:hypothetical protein
MQELVLRLGRRAGFKAAFELATRPNDPWRSTDVGLRDDRRRLLVLVECWNSFGDIGSAARASERKRAEVSMQAVAIGGEDAYAVRACWVVRATARNRALVARYPEAFRARFPGSSRGWVQALIGEGSRDVGRGAGMPPVEPGLVWSDIGAVRLYPWRRA